MDKISDLKMIVINTLALNKAQNSFTNVSRKNDKIVDLKKSLHNKK